MRSFFFEKQDQWLISEDKSQDKIFRLTAIKARNRQLAPVDKKEMSVQSQLHVVTIY